MAYQKSETYDEKVTGELMESYRKIIELSGEDLQKERIQKSGCCRNVPRLFQYPYRYNFISAGILLWVFIIHRGLDFKFIHNTH